MHYNAHFIRRGKSEAFGCFESDITDLLNIMSLLGRKHFTFTLNTSLTAIMSSGPTPSPGTIVTLKVLSARAGGVSEAF